VLIDAPIFLSAPIPIRTAQGGRTITPFALGFRRYGFAAEAARIAHDLNEAASHFVLNQMPELYAGLPRTAIGFPVQYVGANVPQAWAAGSVFMTMPAILGLRPEAPNGWLEIDPVLPPWLPDLTLLGLRLGWERFDIHFQREANRTVHKVLKGDAKAIVRRGRILMKER
jgi:hypothetical protein